MACFKKHCRKFSMSITGRKKTRVWLYDKGISVNKISDCECGTFSLSKQEILIAA